MANFRRARRGRGALQGRPLDLKKYESYLGENKRKFCVFSVFCGKCCFYRSGKEGWGCLICKCNKPICWLQVNVVFFCNFFKFSCYSFMRRTENHKKRIPN